METFTGQKDFVDNPGFRLQRDRALGHLRFDAIDPPIIDVVRAISRVPCCFTMQSCYGHFLHDQQQDPYCTAPLPPSNRRSAVTYKIAYIALCIEDSEPGHLLRERLSRIPAIDPANIQFGCAEWFWARQVNSFALQVEPERHRMKDRVSIDYQEALHLQKIRDRFFSEIAALFQAHEN